MTFRHFLSSVILLSLAVQGYTQSEHWVDEWHYGASSSFDYSSIQLESHFGLASNVLSSGTANALLLGRPITSALNVPLRSADSEGIGRVFGEASADLWFRKLGKGALSLQFGAGAREQIFGTASNGLLQLALIGNGPYEDATLTLGNTKLQALSYQFVGAGIDYRKEKVVVGVTAQLLKVSRWQSLEVEDGSFYTAPFGTALDVYVEGEYRRSGTAQSRPSAWYGTGASINAFLVTRPQLGNGWMFSAQIKDLGFVSLAGSEVLDIYLDTLFTGVDYSLGDASSPRELGEASLDSLDIFFEGGRSTASSNTFLPGSIHFNLVNRFGDKLSLSVALRQYFQTVPPQLRGGLCVSPTAWFSFEPYITIGGFSKVDAGCSLVVVASDKAFVMLKFGTLDGLIQPNNATSQYASLVLRVRI